MDIAHRVANQSRAIRLRVGAVFVSVDGILSVEYNGTPPGWDNTCEDRVAVAKDEPLSGDEYIEQGSCVWYKYVTKPEVLHAERNVFSKIMKAGLSTKQGTLFDPRTLFSLCHSDIFCRYI